MKNIDIQFVRQQFPGLVSSEPLVFCSNAGGSFVAGPVLERMEDYQRRLRVQPYNAFEPSAEAGRAMDLARKRWCGALGIGDDELTLAPSSSANSYVMSQAVGANWGPGDEIVVTAQDHETNVGAWRRRAEAAGATIREWNLQPDSGLLDPEDLYDLLNDKTRWVFFTQCSNVIGTVNPVAEIVAGIRARCAARVCVDAVAHAPHHLCNPRELDVDMYFFSLYKVFGPHQGLLFVRAELQAELQPQGHYFTSADPAKRYNPSGPQHAQVASCAGIIDYLDQVYLHHGGDPRLNTAMRMNQLHELFAAHERELAAPLLDWLDASPAVRLLGKPHTRDGDRAPTIAFVPLSQSVAEVVTGLQQRQIGAEGGNFYAPRLFTPMGLDAGQGVVRLSLLHYNTLAEVGRIMRALDQVLT